MKHAVLVFIAIVMVVLSGCNGGDKTTPVLLTATNKTTPTLCAEEDNVNVQITGETTSFLIEATHPTYNDATGSCEPDFTNCLPGQDVNYPFTPGIFKLFDDGVTVFEAVREAQWWRPIGMTVTVNDGGNETDIHYIRFARKISGESSWPQFLVLYMDDTSDIQRCNGKL